MSEIDVFAGELAFDVEANEAVIEVVPVEVPGAPTQTDPSLDVVTVEAVTNVVTPEVIIDSVSTCGECGGTTIIGGAPFSHLPDPDLTYDVNDLLVQIDYSNGATRILTYDVNELLQTVVTTVPGVGVQTKTLYYLPDEKLDRVESVEVLV
jgi:hypothetical protein